MLKLKLSVIALSFLAGGLFSCSDDVQPLRGEGTLPIPQLEDGTLPLPATGEDGTLPLPFSCDDGTLPLPLTGEDGTLPLPK